MLPLLRDWEPASGDDSIGGLPGGFGKISFGCEEVGDEDVKAVDSVNPLLDFDQLDLFCTDLGER